MLHKAFFLVNFVLEKENVTEVWLARISGYLEPKSQNIIEM